MLKIENVVLPSADQWKSIIMGCRNPLNSWAKSDTNFEQHTLESWPHNVLTSMEGLGNNDLTLMKKLSLAGTDHRKFMRMISVYLDIVAPLYFWKEFSTYKVGTVANSCSTMHKIADKEFTLEDFSHEHLLDYDDLKWGDTVPLVTLECVINALNVYREKYLETKDKDYWWQMIQLLPTSYNQKRTVMLNYEVLANIYKSRRNHKLDEWIDLCEWIKTLPYSELIVGGV